MARVHLFIEGRVQGVGYRAWTEQQALELGLSGWVRNRHDGRVEALFSGEREVIDVMLAQCKLGPRAAQVRHIATDDGEGLECPAGFEVWRTV